MAAAAAAARGRAVCGVCRPPQWAGTRGAPAACVTVPVSPHRPSLPPAPLTRTVASIADGKRVPSRPWASPSPLTPRGQRGGTPRAGVTQVLWASFSGGCASSLQALPPGWQSVPWSPSSLGGSARRLRRRAGAPSGHRSPPGPHRDVGAPPTWQRLPAGKTCRCRRTRVPAPRGHPSPVALPSAHARPAPPPARGMLPERRAPRAYSLAPLPPPCPPPLQVPRVAVPAGPIGALGRQAAVAPTPPTGGRAGGHARLPPRAPTATATAPTTLTSRPSARRHDSRREWLPTTGVGGGGDTRPCGGGGGGVVNTGGAYGSHGGRGGTRPHPPMAERVHRGCRRHGRRRRRTPPHAEPRARRRGGGSGGAHSRRDGEGGAAPP